MSLPGLAVLYGGVMQKRWSVNSMMLTFVAFCVTLIVWCLWAFKMGFGHPIAHNGSGIFGTKGFIGTSLGEPGSVLSHVGEEGQAEIKSITEGPPFHFPLSSLVYFQFVFAAITPILALGSVLGRVNFKAWMPYVALWITCVYAVNAFLLWGGGYFAAHGALDYSGGYVIHLAAGISGFVFAAVIGPRLQRDREVDAPNNLLMVACGAGLLWLGWNGFNGGDSYYAGADASAAVLNTNLCTAVAMMVWIALGLHLPRKAVDDRSGERDDHRPGRHHARSRVRQRLGRDHHRDRRLDDRLDGDPLPQPRTHVPQRRRHPRRDLYARDRGLVRRLDGRPLADPAVVEYIGVHGASNLPGKSGLIISGSWTLLKWQALAAAWVIVYTAIVTFVILKVVGIFVPLRLNDEELEIGDHAIHGNEVYPSDVPTLGGPHPAAWRPAPDRGRSARPRAEQAVPGAARARRQMTTARSRERPRSGGRSPGRGAVAGRARLSPIGPQARRRCRPGRSSRPGSSRGTAGGSPRRSRTDARVGLGDLGRDLAVAGLGEHPLVGRRARPPRRRAGRRSAT